MRAHRGWKNRNAAGVGVVIEGLEGRRLMSVSTWSSQVLSEFNSYDATAGVLYGDNDYSGTASETYVGTQSSTIGGELIWDSDLDDGLQSALVPIEFTLSTVGQDELTQTAEGGDSLRMNCSSGTFSNLIIRAAVQGDNMYMAWHDVYVAFYRNSVLVEQYSLGDIIASSIGSTINGPYESGAIITTAASNYDTIQVFATVELRAAQGVNLGSDGIFGDIYVDGA